MQRPCNGWRTDRELKSRNVYQIKELNGGAGEARTPDLRFRKPTLYPSELQPQLASSLSLPYTIPAWRIAISRVFRRIKPAPLFADSSSFHPTPLCYYRLAARPHPRVLPFGGHHEPHRSQHPDCRWCPDCPALRNPVLHSGQP